MLDQPNDRSSHFRPTPRGGGIAFVAVTFVFSVISLFIGQGVPIAALPLLAAPLAIVGLFDDRYNLPASWRYVVQLLTAFLILAFSPLVHRLCHSNVSFGLLLLILLILVVVFTAVINFSNFMDGIDGLVAGCMAVSFAAMVLILDNSWPLCALVGSLLSFLIWNWSPAKVFMGDVGSTFLGAVFAGLVLQASTWSVAFGCLLLATPLLGDACLCVFRRLLAGQRVFQPHRLHLFQRLHQAGWPHAMVSLTYIVATVLLAVAMLFGGWLYVFSLLLLNC